MILKETSKIDTVSGVIYLASPYYSSSAKVRAIRAIEATAAVEELIIRGINVFSPIAYLHPIAQKYNLALGFESWKHFDLTLLKACSLLAVLMLPGWRDSVGVTAEIKEATRFKIPIEYIFHEENLS